MIEPYLIRKTCLSYGSNLHLVSLWYWIWQLSMHAATCAWVCVCFRVFILLNLCWHTNINRHKVAIIILEPMSTKVYWIFIDLPKWAATQMHTGRLARLLPERLLGHFGISPKKSKDRQCQTMAVRPIKVVIIILLAWHISVWAVGVMGHKCPLSTNIIRTFCHV